MRRYYVVSDLKALNNNEKKPGFYYREDAEAYIAQAIAQSGEEQRYGITEVHISNKAGIYFNERVTINGKIIKNSVHINTRETTIPEEDSSEETESVETEELKIDSIKDEATELHRVEEEVQQKLAEANRRAEEEAQHKLAEANRILEERNRKEEENRRKIEAIQRKEAAKALQAQTAANMAKADRAAKKAAKAEAKAYHRKVAFAFAACVAIVTSVVNVSNIAPFIVDWLLKSAGLAASLNFPSMVVGFFSFAIGFSITMAVTGLCYIAGNALIKFITNRKSEVKPTERDWHKITKKLNLWGAIVSESPNGEIFNNDLMKFSEQVPKDRLFAYTRFQIEALKKTSNREDPALAQKREKYFNKAREFLRA